MHHLRPILSLRYELMRAPPKEPVVSEPRVSHVERSTKARRRLACWHGRCDSAKDVVAVSSYKQRRERGNSRSLQVAVRVVELLEVGGVRDLPTHRDEVASDCTPRRTWPSGITSGKRRSESVRSAGLVEGELIADEVVEFLQTHT